MLGLVAFGPLTMLIFTVGFAGGLVLWLVTPSNGNWADVKAPYWIALFLFVLHRVEEKQFGFFDFLSNVTGASKPSTLSPTVLALVIVSVGAWSLIPPLMKRESPFGTYLAWTFFTSMGITELAHYLVFPWLNDRVFAYVPGMWTVIVLAPVAWWGMKRLALGRR
ncbi:HXXEE domain-containing protein [Mycobacterium sp. G7A2]|uniref:HXXEE domain-containing protein n=1 Tax=Mycobacterium sp. G7A2 TaxID=3317307 RepID=UPI00046584CA